MSAEAAQIAGPLFMTLLFNAGAIGILSFQVLLYHVAFPNDSLRLKIVVWSVYILEIIETFMITSTLYQQFVYGFLDIRSLDRVGGNWFAVPILGGLVTFIVQIFYVHRIAVLGRFLGKKIVFVIVFLVVIISLVQLGAGILLGVELFQTVFYSQTTPHKFQKSAGVLYGTGTTSDIIIALCMTIILLRSSSGTMPRTRKIVRRLVRLTIEAGSLTAAMGVINIIFVMVPAYETYYQTSAAVLSKLYSNTMMAVLNNRMEVSNRELSAQENRLSTLRFSSIGGGLGSANRDSRNERSPSAYELYFSN